MTDIEEAFTVIRRYLQGRPPDAAAYQLAHRLETITTSADGTPTTAVPHTEYVDTTEASKLLGCSERWARELAPRVGGIKRAGAWWIPRDALPTED